MKNVPYHSLFIIHRKT